MNKPNPAEMYERNLVPKVMVPATRELLGAAGPVAGERVLDIACGTGIVGRTAAEVVGERNVVGIDFAPPMIEVARAVAPGIDWRVGNAVSLDLPDRSFDLVTCNHGIQFFPDRPAAAREMRRVLADTGRALVSAWLPLERHPFVRTMITATARVAGVPIGPVAVPFSCPPDDLRALLAAAGFATVEVTEHVIHVRFPVEGYVRQTIGGVAAVIPELASRDLGPILEQVERETADVIAAHRDGDFLALEQYMSVAVARA